MAFMLGRPLITAVAALATAAAVAAPAEPPPTLRLPDAVRPVRQAVELTVDPTAERLSGSVEIELDVRAATRVLWLNAAGLEVKQASLGRPGSLRPAEIAGRNDDFLAFSIGAELAPGPAVFRALFEGAISRRDQEGVFAVQEGGDWYLFTQFEAIAARRAFPCFDEPSFKIPWQVTLRVPRGLVALSNSPAASTRQDDGREVVEFLPTPPLPSYLVAFAVGPFDLVELGPVGRARVPGRLAVPRGRAPDTRWARESTGPILALLEDYFDQPYPYAKLDQVAIPGAGFAMEHPGLVTYAQSEMVTRTAEESIAFRRAWASVCAHELAHQWFGNLVTMAWWDDLWLNESFASWLGEKVTGRFQPAWGVAVERAAQRSGTLALDSVASARRIRQPVASRDDIYNAFDFVTYGKGQAVLEMLEAWLGEDAFRRGVKRYLASHARANATASDFERALSAAAGRDAGPVLRSFLEQTGAPVVSAAVQCDGAPRVELKQRPYAPLGSPAEPKLWQVPVCVRLPGGAAPPCAVLGAQAAEVALPSQGSCPEWSFANAAGAGYYRSVVSAAGARRSLASGSLSAAERVTLAGDLAALVASGDASAAEALALVPLLAGDPDRHVVRESVRLVESLEPLVSDAQVARFRGVVRDAYGERARALGWTAQPGESQDMRLLRRSLVGAAATLGQDGGLEREAVERVSAWLRGEPVLDPDLVQVALAAAVGSGDRALFARLVDEAVASSDRERRERLLFGLGAARDPALVREALALVVDPRVNGLEALAILRGLGAQREARWAAFHYVRANYDAIVARLPRGESSPVPYLPYSAASLCDAAARADAADFFGARTASVPGAPRVLAQVLESLDQCVARKKAHQSGLTAYLEARADR